MSEREREPAITVYIYFLPFTEVFMCKYSLNSVIAIFEKEEKKSLKESLPVIVSLQLRRHISFMINYKTKDNFKVTPHPEPMKTE